MKLLKSILLLGSMVLMAAACQRETAPVQPESYDISFNVSLNVTKGDYGEGADATLLYVFVFDSNGTLLTQSHYSSAQQDWAPHVSLVKGQAYNIAFWAQCDSPVGFLYSFDGSDVVATMGTSNSLNTGVDDVDYFDAFWAVASVSKNGTYDQNVSLVRPLAQLNVLVPVSNLSALPNYPNMQMTAQNLRIQAEGGLPSGMNLLTGKVSRWTTEESMAWLPNGWKMINPIEETIGNSTFARLLGMYFFADDTPTNLSSFKVAISENQIYEVSVDDVTLERNKRTFLMGDIF